jgi:hypothetical protein
MLTHAPSAHARGHARCPHLTALEGPPSPSPTQIHSVTRSLGQIELAYGMLVESRSEAQMPERMFFSCKVSKLDMSRVVEYPPRSHASKNGQPFAPDGAGANPRGAEARNGGSEGGKAGGERSGVWGLCRCLGVRSDS